MAQLKVKIDPKSLECCLCLGRVSDPRILPCGHTFCGLKSADNCLQKLDPRNAGTIKCPICQTDHQVRVADVPPDIKSKELLESLDSKKQGKRMCLKHNKKIVMRCVTDGVEVCVSCIAGDHSGHQMEEVHKQEHKRLSDFWNKENAKIDHKQLNCKARKDFLDEAAVYIENQRLQEDSLDNQLRNLKTRRNAITRKLASDNFNPEDEDLMALKEYMDQLEATSDCQQEASEDALERSQQLFELVASRAPTYCQSINMKPVPPTIRPTSTLEMIPFPSRRPVVTGGAAQKHPTYCQNVNLKPVPPTIRTTPFREMIPGPSRRARGAVLNHVFQPSRHHTTQATASEGGSTSRGDVGRRTLAEENVNCTTNILALGEKGKHYILGLKDNIWEEWKGKRNDFDLGFGAICHQEKVYLIGGCRGEDISSKVAIFHFRKNKWTEGPRLNTPRAHAAACFAESQRSIYICGGSKSGATKDTFNSVEKLELDENGSPVGKWREVTPMKVKRYACAAVVVGIRLFVTGGQNLNTNILSSVEIFDTKTEEWSYGPQLKQCRKNHAVEHYHGSIYAMGGYNGVDAADKMDSFEKLDLQSLTWTSIVFMRVARFSFGSVVANGKIYVVGGHASGDDEDRKSVEIFDPVTNKWSTGPQLPKIFGFTQCVRW